uniref:Pyrrolo-quinoline quinone repeat domain-containing protein n=2 Tax=Chenopodium quinoa TaxID=63459 RepID=A0A803N051_CHEQI
KPEYQSKWLNHGGDLQNRRYAELETKISPKTAQNLKLNWEFEAKSYTTATPAIYEGTIYFTSFDGNVYAIKQSDGSLVWKQNLHEITGFNSTIILFKGTLVLSRATPTIANDLVIVTMYGPAVVLGFRRESGEFVWMTRLEDHPDSVITMSGTYYNGGYYVGTSSLEELASIDKCCTFRGSFAKLEAKTGKIQWQTYMLPDNQGKQGEYSGAAIWGSSPSIDVSRNLVYIATGNLYSAPERVEACQERENNQTIPTHPEECIEPENHENSILALELESGDIKWYQQLGGYDVWFAKCMNLSTPNCPPGPNPDADFGEAPMLLSVVVNGCRRDVSVAVQKSGIAWGLDRDTGDVIWSTEAGPGGMKGGGIWGAATDGKRVYTNIANSDAKNFTLKPSNLTTKAGGWVAIDPRGGEILWTTANPSNGVSFGPVTVANGVVFAGSYDKQGNIYAMDAKNGAVLWSYETGSEVYGGVSVGDGCVYVANGYWTAGKSLFAFCV